MLNLLNILTEEDKEIFKQYMLHYSEAGDYYCGNDKFLIEWAKNKKKLYGLLGNQLKVKFPFCYKKDEEAIKNDLIVLYKSSSFLDNICTIYMSIHNPKCLDMDKSNYFSINGAHFRSSFINNEPLDVPIKLKFLNTNKSLNINKGIMPIRALGKIINYIYDNSEKTREKYPNLKEEYELFRQKHSLIFNEKELKGDLVISINPIDFVTMSNNASDWHSCMQWDNNNLDEGFHKQHSGCYHLGTIEMMNSNNVVCCYLESKTPYTFYTDDAGTTYSCSNKKWRSIFIITPEIILSGKGYPYQNNRFNYFLLDKLKELALKNKHWKYTYGIEEYKDMKHIDSPYIMEKNSTFIEFCKTTKHNILLDTIGMYNDFFNDKETTFYCYRNKVKRNTIITYSGKGICSCCGEQMATRRDIDVWTEDYNDRLPEEIVGKDVCYKCYEKFNKCEICDIPIINDSIALKDHDGKKICYKCFKVNYTKCPSCHKIYNIYNNDKKYQLFSKKEDYDKEVNESTPTWERITYLHKLNCCDKCEEDIVKNEKFGKMFYLSEIAFDTKRLVIENIIEDSKISKFYEENAIEVTEEEF